MNEPTTKALIVNGSPDCVAGNALVSQLVTDVTSYVFVAGIDARDVFGAKIQNFAMESGIDIKDDNISKMTNGPFSTLPLPLPLPPCVVRLVPCATAAHWTNILDFLN